MARKAKAPRADTSLQAEQHEEPSDRIVSHDVRPAKKKRKDPIRELIDEMRLERRKRELRRYGLCGEHDPLPKGSPILCLNCFRRRMKRKQRRVIVGQD